MNCNAVDSTSYCPTCCSLELTFKLPLGHAMMVSKIPSGTKVSNYNPLYWNMNKKRPTNISFRMVIGDSTVATA